jgi:hypothetical protein
LLGLPGKIKIHTSLDCHHVARHVESNITSGCLVIGSPLL